MNAPWTLPAAAVSLFERHDLVWIDPSKMEGLAAYPPSIHEWIIDWVRDHPLVVARRTPEDVTKGVLCLGLSGPREDGGKPLRIAVRCNEAAVRAHRSPLTVTETLALLPSLALEQRRCLEKLTEGLTPFALEARVFGSYAMAALSGRVDLIASGSDLDLLLVMDTPRAPVLDWLSHWNASSSGQCLPVDGEVRLRGVGDINCFELGRAKSLERVLIKTADQVKLQAVPLLSNPLPSMDAIVALADEALSVEASAYPKPGLVSPVDSGSHHDMDYALLQRARVAIRPGFYDLARVARAGGGFKDLVRIGIAMEQDMMRATAGVNVYRGAIFNLGLLVAAAAIPGSSDLLATVCDHFGAAILQHRPPSDQHGSRLRQREGVGGALMEAAAGFPVLRNWVLPAWRESRRAGHEAEQSLIAALMASVARLEDTNLLWRGGRAGLAFAQNEALTFLAQQSVFGVGWKESLMTLHHTFVKQHLSPGGSADLAACAHFVGMWSERR